MSGRLVMTLEDGRVEEDAVLIPREYLGPKQASRPDVDR